MCNPPIEKDPDDMTPEEIDEELFRQECEEQERQANEAIERIERSREDQY